MRPGMPFAPRFVLALVLAGCASAASASAAGRPAPAPSARGRGGPIHQEIVLAAAPERVYEVLLDSTQFAAFTHLPAAIDRAVGGEFRTFGGMIQGRNIELVPGRRIVQAWRVHDWPEGVYSVVRFVLKPEGTGTRLVLTHSNYEEGEGRAGLEKGWPERYWKPLAAYLHSGP